MAERRKTNRGPVAGPENRAALITAARAVFDESGVEAPLSAVAKRAGVGQGSLYRHFPDRLSLAVAVFEENMEQIDRLAERPESTLRDIVDLVTHQTEGTAAFIALVAIDDPDGRTAVFEQRLRQAFAAKWDAREDFLGPHATLNDLMLAIGMVAGAVTQVPRAQRHEVATSAWELLRRGLAD